LCAEQGRAQDLRQRAKSVVQLYRDAYSQETTYQKFVRKLADKTEGEYTPARIKGAHRTLKKMVLRLSKNPAADNVLDAVRGTLVYSEMRNMLTAFCFIVSASVNAELRKLCGSWDAETAGIEDRIDILRVKNRFAKPTGGGWADLLVSFTFCSDPNKHICELQLCHKALMTVRKNMGAQDEYARFRSAVELLEVTGHADRITEIENEDESMDVTKFGESSVEVKFARFKTATEQKWTDTEYKLATTERKVTSKLKDTEKKLTDTEQKLASKLKAIAVLLIATEQKLAVTDRKLAAAEQKWTDTEQKLTSKLKDTERKLAFTEEKLTDTENRLATTEHRLEATEQKWTDTEQKLVTKLTDTEKTLFMTNAKLEQIFAALQRANLQV